MSVNVLLVSDEMIKERTSIHGNIDPKLLYPDIKVAQDMYIEPILGTALYVKIQTLISGGAIAETENVAYKLLLDKFIVDALMYYTLTDLPTTISYQFWNKGVIRKGGENQELPSMSELVDLSNKYKTRAEYYGNRLRLYLKQNATDAVLPEFLNAGDGCDAVQPEHRTFTSPVYLGNKC